MQRIIRAYIFLIITQNAQVVTANTFSYYWLEAASHIDWNSHSVLGLHLFMFHYIILTFDCNAKNSSDFVYLNPYPVEVIF